MKDNADWARSMTLLMFSYFWVKQNPPLADRVRLTLQRKWVFRIVPRWSCRRRNRRDKPGGQRLAPPGIQLRWIEPVRARDRRHVRSRRKRLPDDPLLLLPRPGATAPPRTDRKPLSRSRDNFEILAIRNMFALMISWGKSPGDSLTIEHYPLCGVTYALTGELGRSGRPYSENPDRGQRSV